MNKQKISSVQRTAYIGMMAAVVCVVTIFRFPLGQSQVHFANSMCLLGGLLLGPVWGGMAAGLGSACYDLFTPYAPEAYITFITKFAMAWMCGVLAGRALEKRNVVRVVLSCVIGALTYVALYLGKSWIMLTIAGSSTDAIVPVVLAKAPASLINAAMASVAAPIFYFALLKPVKKLGLPWGE